MKTRQESGHAYPIVSTLIKCYNAILKKNNNFLYSLYRLNKWLLWPDCFLHLAGIPDKKWSHDWIVINVYQGLGQGLDIDIWNMIRVSRLPKLFLIVVCDVDPLQTALKVEDNNTGVLDFTIKNSSKMDSGHPMAAQQYYSTQPHHQGMYGAHHRDYTQATSQYHHAYSQGSCLYSSGKPSAGMGTMGMAAGYGNGQSMSVVEQYFPADGAVGAGGLNAHSFTLAAAAALQSQQGHQGHPSHHLQSHLNGTSHLGQALSPHGLRGLGGDRQPPPAHTQHHLQHSRHPDGKISPGSSGSRSPGSAGSQNTLHFPWMKTTKSHAHQWKANWSGKSNYLISYISRII